MIKYVPVFFIALAFCLSCRNTNPTTIVKSPGGGSQKITVYKENVYDLSGYEDEGRGKPFNLFDENAYSDPRAENRYTANNYIPVTDPHPKSHPAIYFSPGKGSRIVTDLQTAYKLSEVYLYDRAYTSDSIWIYTGDMMHWKLKVAFTTKGDAGLWGWRRFALEDSSQYVMIRFSSYESSITEMVLYGSPYGAVPPPPSHEYKAAGFTKTMMKEFLGANCFDGIDSKWVKPFYYTRLYAFAVDFDNDTEHEYPDIKYNMMRFGYWNTGTNEYSFFTEDIERQYNNKVWYAMIGLPLWMNTTEYGALGRPVTKKNMDSEDPLSYARHANMMWNLAAFFGNTKVDTNLLSLSHSPRSSGRGTLSVYEDGSEDDANWLGNKYCNPVEYFAQSSADYDGHEGALGSKCGIRNADNTSLLMTGGLIELDTNRIRIYKFLCNTLRKDKSFLWKGGVQYHHYSIRKNHGITPEEDSLRQKLAKVKQFTDRIQPGVPCILGENGYDKSQQSRQATPLLPGLSNAECQAIFILRSVNATAFSGFDSYILYWLKDNEPEDDPRVYLTSGVVRELPDGSIKPYPSWFYISAFVNRLANYSPAAIVSEKDNAWIYKYQNRLSPDSVAYFVYSPTHNGTKKTNYVLKTGRTINDDAQEINFVNDNAEGSRLNKKIVNGAVTVTVEERPKLIMVREQ